MDSVTQGSGADHRNLNLAYNNDGYLASVTDPLDRTERYVYDPVGRLKIQTLAD